jgi:hypothetical protein
VYIIFEGKCTVEKEKVAICEIGPASFCGEEILFDVFGQK